MNQISALQARIDGEVHTDRLRRIMYATDASDYREMPLAVVYPRGEQDIRELVRFARHEKLTLIPRAAGTSLAGQVVGSGIVVDVSRYMNEILEINPEERWVRVQPGVVLDELNLRIREKGLFFSPETSTSNRSMIGGMIGNNSCGLHSLIYGDTRQHTRSIRAVLGDGSVAEFGSLTPEELKVILTKEGLEGQIYRELNEILSDPENQEEILKEYPDPGVVRRNTGYALDELLQSPVFIGDEARYPDLNLCRVLAGSEGTLIFMTEAILNLVPLPPSHKVLVPVHFDSVRDAIRGNLMALAHQPSAVELMDKTILDCTRDNITQKKNRFFLKGDPGAILIVEFMGHSEAEILERTAAMEQEMVRSGIGTHFPVVRGKEISRVWALRKAGLGVLSNLPGEGRPVSVIEDTSVNVEMLEAYIEEFDQILDKYGLQCVYHAHISVGELHLRPILNLKDPEHVRLFHQIAMDTARLVKKYRGSLSGEHGDGRLRGEFIELMVGAHNYSLLKRVKQVFDPDGVFNAGKIIDTPPMNSFLRFDPGHKNPDFETYFDYSREGGFMNLVEKCNGSGDCRKTELTGGTMCPSYMATRDEFTTTRARANVLREMLGRSELKDPFNQRGIYDVLDLCLSCKACKSECPSSVDMAKLKAEFLQHWYNHHRVPVRTRLIAHITSINRMGQLVPGLFNRVVTQRRVSGILKKTMGFAVERSIPTIGKQTLRKWAGRHLDALNSTLPESATSLVLYVDEFTNHNDTSLGITAIRLLNRLGFRVKLVPHPVSGRTFISKGLLKQARRLARKNILQLERHVSATTPLVGIEPSAILGFRDEFPDLVGEDLRRRALELAEHCFTVEEYLSEAFERGKIDRSIFTPASARVKLHGHCQQKAIASTSPSLKILSIPENYRVEEIPSGCCGMAGSFGYEKEHFEISMKVGELVLFPAIRDADSETIIAAPGTSCRHQIKDGTGTAALHPLEVLYQAIR